MLSGVHDFSYIVPKTRVGLSAGMCVQYRFCERTDYYGCTVIMAARLAQLGSGFLLGPLPGGKQRSRSNSVCSTDSPTQ
jgi:hypothetical protein